MKRKFLSIILSIIMVVPTMFTIHADVTSEKNQIETFDTVFEDETLKSLILDSKEIERDTPIQVVVDYISGSNGTLGYPRKSGPEITNLKGVERLVNIQIIQLPSHSIKDLSPLDNLPLLNNLQLSDNKITDSVLKTFNGKGLIGLNDLNLSDNEISDISPLASIMAAESRNTPLTSLRLNNNKISDISPLGKFKDLTQLYLDNNSIYSVNPELYNIAQTARLIVSITNQKISMDRVEFTGNTLKITNPINVNDEFIKLTNISNAGVQSDDLSEIVWEFPNNAPQNVTFDFTETLNEKTIWNSEFSGKVTIPVDKKEVMYTITYTDGVDNEEVFADQVYSNLPENSSTPEFQGTPTREGYTFEGWLPQVSTTVTGDAIYVAQWKKIVEPIKEYSVSYTDGVENEEVFADQVYSNLPENSLTPEFQGTPTREGYTFEGWLPQVSTTVTGDAIYVAQWKKIVEPIAPIDPTGPNTPQTQVDPEKPKLPVTGVSENYLGYLSVMLGGLVISFRLVSNKKIKPHKN